jgi:dephospho-CoA kinase
MEKVLIILRGLPGSGKSTVAEIISENGKYPICCADDYFLKNIDGKTVYQFDASKLGAAHIYCKSKVLANIAMNREKIIISNTNTTEKEMQIYFDLAAQFNYKVLCLIVENRHNGVNIHGVSNEQLQKMKNRFNIKL